MPSSDRITQSPSSCGRWSTGESCAQPFSKMVEHFAEPITGWMTDRMKKGLTFFLAIGVFFWELAKKMRTIVHRNQSNSNMEAQIVKQNGQSLLQDVSIDWYERIPQMLKRSGWSVGHKIAYATPWIHTRKYSDCPWKIESDLIVWAKTHSIRQETSLTQWGTDRIIFYKPKSTGGISHGSCGCRVHASQIALRGGRLVTWNIVTRVPK